MNTNQRLHWFCFSFMGQNERTGDNYSTSVYSGGYPSKNITRKIIDENKYHAEVPDSAALIAVTYLGKMTREEFLEK